MASNSPGNDPTHVREKAIPNQGILLADMSWAKYIGRMMNAFRLRNQYCDLSIIGCDGQSGPNGAIRAHSLILSAASPMLKQLIDQLGGHDIIQIAEIPCWLWEIILKFVYTGEVLIPITDIHKLVQVETVGKNLQIKQMQAAAQEAIKFAKKLHETKTPYTKLKSHAGLPKVTTDKTNSINIHIADEQSQLHQDHNPIQDQFREDQVIQQSTNLNNFDSNPVAHYHQQEMELEQLNSSQNAKTVVTRNTNKQCSLSHLTIETKSDKIPSPRYEQITPEVETTEKPHFFCTSPISEDENVPHSVFGPTAAQINQHAKSLYSNTFTNVSDIDMSHTEVHQSTNRENAHAHSHSQNVAMAETNDQLIKKLISDDNYQSPTNSACQEELAFDDISGDEPTFDDLKIEVNFEEKDSKEKNIASTINEEESHLDPKEHCDEEIAKEISGVDMKAIETLPDKRPARRKNKKKRQESPVKKCRSKRIVLSKVDDHNDKKHKDELDSDGLKNDEDSEDETEKSSERKPRLPTVKCEECDKRVCANYLRKHYLLMHKEKCRLLTCVFCDFVSLEKLEYLKHMRTHTGNKPHVCRDCKEPFARAELLKDHIMKVHKHEKHQCKLCDKEFSSVAAFRSHKATIHDKKKRNKPNRKPKVCSICGHTFWMTGDLRAHEMAHRGEKPFQCSQCDLRFTTKSHLKKHEIVHTNEKPFMCSFCGFASNRKANLRAHERRHTGEVPFECDVCNERFRVAHQLKMHKLKTHGIDMTVEAMKKHGGIDLRRKPSKIPETQKQKKQKAQAAKVLLPVISTKTKELRMTTLAAAADLETEPPVPTHMGASNSLDAVSDLSQDLGTIPALEGIEEQPAVLGPQDTDNLLPSASQQQALSVSKQVHDLVTVSSGIGTSVAHLPQPEVFLSPSQQPISSFPAYSLSKDSSNYSMTGHSSLPVQFQSSNLALDGNLTQAVTSTTMATPCLPSELAVPANLGYYSATTTMADTSHLNSQTISIVNTQGTVANQSLDTTAESLMSLFVNGNYTHSAFITIPQQSNSGLSQQPPSS